MNEHDRSFRLLDYWPKLFSPTSLLDTARQTYDAKVTRVRVPAVSSSMIWSHDGAVVRDTLGVFAIGSLRTTRSPRRNVALCAKTWSLSILLCAYYIYMCISSNSIFRVTYNGAICAQSLKERKFVVERDLSRVCFALSARRDPHTGNSIRTQWVYYAV
jgi:hypothetical protein